MYSLLYFIYLFILALLLALLEVQIEGKYGWAKNLPTWRPHTHKWYARLYGKIMSGKELTGYHAAMFSFVLMLMHFPFVVGVAWSWQGELWVLSVFFLFDILWDFLWFIVNPHYGLNKFESSYIAWHKKWIGPMPMDYIGGIVVSFIILLPTMLFGGVMLGAWAYIILLWTLLLFVVTLIGLIGKTIKIVFNR